MKNNYDIIVVGAGHAGIEAAISCAKRNQQVALITLSKKHMASLPCNPSIGGPAKGIVVREIDALGGVMAKVADQSALQFKMLNLSKGPGVRALRVQSDKNLYSSLILDLCKKQKNLTIIEEMVIELIVKNKTIKGVILKNNTQLYSKIVILTTGTYMNSKIMISNDIQHKGPLNLETTNKLSQSLLNNGMSLFRLKTGTPPRIKSNTIDYSKVQLEPGTDLNHTFSEETKSIIPFNKQYPCYLTYTNNKTHKIIKDNINKSSMYSGIVTGIGPRYCPSIEDKLVRFADKERHQLFLEPESISLDTTYIAGLSSSLPKDIQQQMVNSIVGLENAIIDKYAYAIEYDAINPLTTKPSLESKIIKNLFTAGQINGTSGYEEAAGAGLIAGINACNKLKGLKPLILGIDESYIGIMIDDICNKGTLEPYRLLTSRAQFRLLLRHDNASERLIKYGYKYNLISNKRYLSFNKYLKDKKRYTSILKNTYLNNKSNINTWLINNNYSSIKNKISALELLKRPDINIDVLLKYLNMKIPSKIAESIQINIKYSGYINKALSQIKSLKKMDNIKLKNNIDYNSINSLSLEGKQKLSLVRPITIGQASRISGVSPADIMALVIHLEKERKNKHGNKRYN